MSILHTASLPLFQEICWVVGWSSGEFGFGFFLQYMYLDSPFGTISKFLSLGHLKIEFFHRAF